MDGKLYIKKFIRDDGATLAFDGEEIYLADDNTLLVRPDPSTTSVAYTGADGGEMIRQQAGIYEQEVNGLIIPRTTAYWALVARLSQFFRFNHNYRIIYIEKDGNMFTTNGAWISSGLQIVPQPREDYSEWSISFSIGDSVWTEYSENSQGQETYSNNVILPLLTANAGGEIWDSVGLVSDNVGAEWEVGSGGAQTVYITSTRDIYPVWVVSGPCTNPTLQNNTTDTYASFDGSLAEGQTLTVDFAAGTAYINTALATRYVSGYVTLAPGNNVIGFNSDGGATETSTVSWNNAIN